MVEVSTASVDIALHAVGGRFGFGKGIGIARHFRRIAVEFDIRGIQQRLIGGVRGPLRFEQRLQFFRRDLLALLKRLFEDRVLDDLLVDHLLQFKAVELKDRDHLDQARRQNLLLRDFQLQSGRKHTHTRHYTRS